MNEQEFKLLHRTFFSEKRRVNLKSIEKAVDRSRKLEDTDSDLTTYYLKINTLSGASSVSGSLGPLPRLCLAKGRSISKNISIFKSKNKSIIQSQFEEKPLKYVIFKGNNSEVIRRVMKKRTGWEEIPCIEHSNAHFIWQPIAKNLRFDRLLPYLPKQVANHFENHFEITDKKFLFLNLSNYCVENSKKISEFVPKTYLIELSKNEGKAQTQHFIYSFRTLLKKNPIWIIKPSGLNRGQGIKLFSSLAEFRTMIKEFSLSKECEAVVVQKYIENPLLINSRKFDIRVWALVTHEYKCFFCKEGYIRTSSEVFSLDSSLISNSFVHLTNNAVQKKGKNYGKFEDGNQIDLNSLKEALPEGTEFSQVYARIKEIVRTSLLAVRKKLNPQKRQFCFEVFGYDFLIDSNCKVWLIECNTNPCLELSSKLLEKLVPKMLDEAFGLTVDRIFARDQTENTLWEYLVSL